MYNFTSTCSFSTHTSSSNRQCANTSTFSISISRLTTSSPLFSALAEHTAKIEDGGADKNLDTYRDLKGDIDVFRRTEGTAYWIFLRKLCLVFSYILLARSQFPLLDCECYSSSAPTILGYPISIFP